MKKSKIIYNIIIVVCIITIIISSYNIITWFVDNKKNNSIISNIYQQAEITYETVDIESEDIDEKLNENINKMYYNFNNLLETNENTVGWINVKNTNIDYPVVQYTDNSYYLKHSFDNTSNSAGWIFADYQNKLDGSDYNIVIYRA